MEHYGSAWCHNCKNERLAHMPDGKCLFGPASFLPMSTDEFCKLLYDEYMDPPDDREPFAEDDYYDDYLILREKHWSIRNHTDPPYDTKDKRFP